MSVGYSEIEFVGPAATRSSKALSSVSCEYGGSLRQGAVFYNADATESTVLWLLKCGVEDGRGQMVGERLIAIHGTGDRFRKSQPYALLDLKAPEGGPMSPRRLGNSPRARTWSSTGRSTR